MRILLLQSTSYLYPFGGAHRCNRSLLEGLSARGHSCVVVSPAAEHLDACATEQTLQKLTSTGIDVVRVAANTLAFNHNSVDVYAVTEPTQLYTQALRQIIQFEPDHVLVSSEDPSQLLLEMALEVAPGRVVYIAHTPATLPAGPEAYVQDDRKVQALQQSSAVITVSDYVRRYIHRWIGIDAAVLPFPVYGQGPFSYYDHFDSGFVTMINPSRIKGISIFLELASRLPGIAFAAVPTWATTGADQAVLRRQPNVHLLSASERIDDILSRTRVLLVPSLWAEAFGLVVVEAMLRGIPVLASDVGGLPEAKLGVDYLLPVRAVTGYLRPHDDPYAAVAVVPEQDVEPWEAALCATLGSRSAYDRLALASRDAAHTFVSGVRVERFEVFLRNLGQLGATGGIAANQPRIDPLAAKRGDDGSGRLSDLSAERRALLGRRLRAGHAPSRSDG